MRVAIIEDHALFRETIAAVVASMDELELGAVLAGAKDALESFEVEQPDLALVDLSLADMTGLELVTRIRQNWPAVRCVILSGHRRDDYARQALSAGASAYILKGRPDDFREGIRTVLDGRRYVSEAVRPADWNG